MARAAGLAGVILAATAACAAKGRLPLEAPDDAPPWSAELAGVFDDGYSRAPLELTGRAPNDVLDQDRFTRRFGNADIVAVVTVEQSWARGRHGRDAAHHVDVHLERVLMGEWPAAASASQLLPVVAPDGLPEGWRGQRLLLFVRWAPGEKPSYHHHLIPATPELVAYIGAEVERAKKAGELRGSGKVKRRRR